MPELISLALDLERLGFRSEFLQLLAMLNRLPTPSEL